MISNIEYIYQRSLWAWLIERNRSFQSFTTLIGLFQQLYVLYITATLEFWDMPSFYAVNSFT